MSVAVAGGSGGLETPGRKRNIDSGSGFTPTGETVVHFSRWCYDNLAKFGEKNWGLSLVSFLFVMFPIAIVDLLLVQMRPSLPERY